MGQEIAPSPKEAILLATNSPKPSVWIDKARQMQLWKHLGWIRLLHYKRTLWGGFKSEAGGDDFFAHPQGAFHPQLELEASVLALFRSEPRELKAMSTVRSWPFVCQLPARARWLQDQLQIPEQLLPKVSCPEFEAFRSKLKVRSLTLVFSSYYVNSPSSTFGHTLLRMNRRSHMEGHEGSQLLDFGVNYAANPTTSNPILYALLGLTGGFPGTYTILPYFYKVREYNDYEARDLWEYDLDLTPEEVDQYVAHLWELIWTPFDYYYLKENCSYEILTLLEVAAPRLHLTERLPYWVIPSDTIKAVDQEPHFIQRIYFRPSIQRQLFARMKELSSLDSPSNGSPVSFSGNLSGQVLSIAEKGDLSGISSFSIHDRARILDASIDYLDYKYSEELLLKKEPALLEKKNRLLLERSHLPTLPSFQVPVPWEEAPHRSHGSARGGLSQSSTDETEISFKFAFHDFHDSHLGFSPYTEVDFFHLNFLYKVPLLPSQSSEQPQRKVFFLKNWTLLGLTSFFPVNSMENRFSWRAKMGFQRSLYRFGNFQELSVYFDAGAGWSFEMSKVVLLYLLGDVHLGRSFHLSDHHSVALGPTLGARAFWTQSWSAGFEVNQFYELISKQMPGNSTFARAFVTYSPISRLMLDLGGEKVDFQNNGSQTQLSLGVFAYFN